MTTPKPDDRLLVDPHVAAAWRDVSNDEPPASVDAAILAAARREVTAGPESIDTREARTDRRRWWPLAAAATVAAVVVGVVQLTPTEKLGAPAVDTGVVSDVPATAAPPPAASMPAQPPVALPRPDAAPPVAPTPAPFPAAKPTPEGVPPAPPAARSAAPTAPAEPGPPPAVPPAPTPDPFPVAKQAAADTAAEGQLAASPPPAPPRSEAAQNVARERDSSAAREAPAPPPAAQGATRVSAERPPTPPSATLGKMATGRAADSGIDDVRANARTPLPVPEWIALIRRLRAEGKPAEAAKELAAFRAAHADHEKLLPPDLRDWQPQEK